MTAGKNLGFRSRPSIPEIDRQHVTMAVPEPTDKDTTLMEHSRETIAMLIDADNSPSDKIDFILAELAKYGVVNIRRAYGNWKSRSLKGWEDKLHDYAIRPIQQFDYTKGKNATDMAMTIDGMDLLYGSKLDAFCIVSSDSDFTPLVMRILSEGLNVYGFGQKSTPAPFVNACSTFLYLESIGAITEKSKTEGGRRKSPHELKGDSKLLTLIRNAVDSAQEEDGWSNLAKIGKNIANQASFDPRNYGFKRLSDLIRSIDLFEIEFRNKNSELYIRDKRKARRPEHGGSPQPDPAAPVPSQPQGHGQHQPQAHAPVPAQASVLEESPLPEPAVTEVPAARPVAPQEPSVPAAVTPEEIPQASRAVAVPPPSTEPEPVLPEAIAEAPAALQVAEPAAAVPAEAPAKPKRKPRRPARKKAEAETPSEPAAATPPAPSAPEA